MATKPVDILQERYPELATMKPEDRLAYMARELAVLARAHKVHDA